ncbi:hypothetical protein [Bosea sp. RAC05]|uniref:hypothetical protein n=1 Tax=Bosea sp. RAC05 TaxID=1842539 RepID=UPI00083D8FE9|nr:hypothetical protein [Bosea sp. RAC05]AOG02902.1 hypothetical protein BSY19_5316 [Bosea sp. RAC05]
MDHIELDVAFAYPVTYQKSRARTPRKILVGDRTKVKIPNLSAEDAPVALRLIETDNNGAWRHVLERRVANGQSLSRATAFVDCVDLDRCREMIQTHTGTHELFQGQWRMETQGHHLEPWRDPEATHFHATLPLDADIVLSERRDEMAKFVERVVEKSFVIDGELWWPAPEPMIEVTLSREGPTHPISIRLDRAKSAYASEHGFMFAPEHFDVAKDFARQWAHLQKPEFSRLVEGLDGRRRIHWHLRNIEVDVRDTGLLGSIREAALNASAGASMCMRSLTEMMFSLPAEQVGLIHQLAVVRDEARSGDTDVAQSFMAVLDMIETSVCGEEWHYARQALTRAIAVSRDAVSRSCDMALDPPACDKDDDLSGLAP